jgi:peptide/nickel transport system substrate-binding protein
VKSSRTRALAIFATLLLLLTVSPLATPRAHAAAPSLVIAIGYEPVTLDPQVDYDTAAAIVLGNVYDSLVRAVGDKKVTVVPDLATSWKSSADGKTWTFKLRSGVKFHDGSAVDSKAVQFTFQRLFKLQTGAFADYTSIDRVDAPDPLTVVFHLKAPFPSFLTSLTSLWGPGIVSPKTVLAHQVKGDLGQKWLMDHDAGSGPWMVNKWVHGQKITLDPFPGYYKGWSGQHVGQVVYEWPTASSTQRLGLERGDIDIAMNMTPQDFDAVAKENGMKVEEYTGQTIRDIRINTTHGPLKSKLVRQALSYSFDYEGIVKAVFKGHAVRMTGVGPTGLANYIPAKPLYTFDLTKAKSMLAKAGYPNGFNVQVTWQQGDAQSQLMAEIWQQEVKPLGINMKLQVLPSAQYSTLSHKASTSPDIFLGQWTMDYADDQQMYWSYFYSKILPPASGNVMYYKNPKVDVLLEKAQSAPTAEQQHALYAQMLPIVYDDAPEIWAAQPNDRVAMRANVKGFEYNFLYSSYYYDLYALSKS